MNDTNTKAAVNCRACKHYYITWDAKHPYGCRKMGFKGTVLPSITVLKNSGRPCQYFQEKAKSSKR